MTRHSGGAERKPRALVVAHRFSGERLFDSTDAFEHVVDAQQRRACGHLENPRRLGLDLFTYQRMEPFAGGKINLDTEALLKQSLGRHQIQGIESPARVIVDKKISRSLFALALLRAVEPNK